VKAYRTHILLFLATVVTTTLSGAEWIYGSSFLSGNLDFSHFKQGFWFSIPFLSFLTFHEFGHYFMAKMRGVRVSLPYYIPGWIGIVLSIGTFGAFIRIKDPVHTRKDFFDIGIAGPLAGAVVAVICLLLGFYYLPGDEYVYGIHPEYRSFGGDYRTFLDQHPEGFEAIRLGKSLLYTFLEQGFADPARLPHPYELSHYPLILAGFLGLLFTAINLLPMGQLDGGHILYALVGPRAFRIISPAVLVALVSFSGLGLYTVPELASGRDGMDMLYFLGYVFFVYLCFSKIFPAKLSNVALALAVVLFQLLLTQFFPGIQGYPGFLAFGFLVGRVLGVYHPPTYDVEPLSRGRVVLGWFAMLLFVLCFIPYPLA
jgi:membrane-associated protease RseP (regulator of RpoE activity)